MQIDPGKVLVAAMATEPAKSIEKHDQETWEDYQRLAAIAQKVGIPVNQKLSSISVDDILIAASGEDLAANINSVNLPEIVRRAEKYIEGLMDGWSNALVSAIKDTLAEEL